MIAEKYTSSKKEDWDNFISVSNNGTLLHKRDFMEYHSDRFEDHSLMIYDKNKLIALYPANIVENVIYSHQGLTYGAFILQFSISLSDVLKCFETMLEYYKTLGIQEVNYKCIPNFYSKYPSHSDEYGLFINGFQLTRRDTSFVVDLTGDIRLQTRRKRSIKKAISNGIDISKSNSFELFWKNVLEPNLKEKYNQKPVHSLSEIQYLSSKFPKNILQYDAFSDGDIVAGATLFISNQTVHAQYIASTSKGRESGALDLLFNELIFTYYKDFKYFSFGISNEQNGKYLNKGLAEWKEGFSGKVWMNDFYTKVL